MPIHRHVTRLTDLQLPPGMREKVADVLTEFIAAEVAREVRRLTQGPPPGETTDATASEADSQAGRGARRSSKEQRGR